MRSVNRALASPSIWPASRSTSAKSSPRAVDAIRLSQPNGNAIGSGDGHPEDGNGHVPDAAYADIEPFDPGALQVIDLTEVRHTYP